MKRINTDEGPYFMRTTKNDRGISVYISKKVNGYPSNFWYWVASGLKSLKDFTRKDLEGMVERYEEYYDKIAKIDG